MSIENFYKIKNGGHCAFLFYFKLFRFKADLAATIRFLICFLIQFNLLNYYKE